VNTPFNPNRFWQRSLWPTALLVVCAHSLWGADDDAGIDLVQMVAPKIEDLARVPKNLSRWHMGASILLPRPGGDFQAVSIKSYKDYKEALLLGDDESVAYPLAVGEKDIVIDLAGFHHLERFFFISFNARGSCKVHVSNELQPIGHLRWQPVGRLQRFKPGDRINLTFPVVEARFVHVHFEAFEAGGISSLGIFGQTTIAETEYISRKEHADTELTGNEDLIPFDYSSLYTGSTITHVSSGDLVDVNAMIDDDILTYYEFDADENESVMILDLSNEYAASSFSLVLDAGRGDMEFYFMDSLPDAFVKKDIEIDENHPLYSQINKNKAGRLPGMAASLLPDEQERKSAPTADSAGDEQDK